MFNKTLIKGTVILSPIAFGGRLHLRKMSSLISVSEMNYSHQTAVFMFNDNNVNYYSNIYLLTMNSQKPRRHVST